MAPQWTALIPIEVTFGGGLFDPAATLSHLQRNRTSAVGSFARRQLLADSVEKLLSDLRRGVIQWSPKTNRVTIVDPGPFYEVDFFLQFRTVSFSTE